MILALTGAIAAQSAKETSARPVAGKSGDPRKASKGPLPDPVLLDGSQQAAEKRSEMGMIGEFELPGDENVRDGKVGGQQGQPGGQEQQQQQQAGGAGQPPPGQEQAKAGGGAPDQQQQEQQLAGGQQGQQGSGQPGQGDPNAKPEGIQVASLQGEGGGNPADVAGQKPKQVSIGDSAMQIKTQQNAPTIVGAQQPAGKTQQHEKATGTGGRPPTGDNTNKGAERGRAMPAGL